ncbi:hypothetical protein [Cohnella silvisoli]|uniref:Uncharacterized protein n=1 Tax=Cohnella silvisoli TaxID=2873699 RepID=A0ABV1KWF5_9BACL|nr:hypothetical protein [Cohnella silvisoli]MCD9023772.1 hypothetical protein [Cohnella silvisoli]
MSQATLELILGELRNFRTEVNEEFQEVRAEIQAVRSELKEEIQAVRSELKEEIQVVWSELKEEIQTVRTEFKDDIQSVRSEFAQEFKTFKKDQQAILNRLNSHENLYAQLIGLIKSVKETVTGIAERQDVQERKFSFQLNTQAGIEILNREQLMMKTEIEMLKNRY